MWCDVVYCTPPVPLPSPRCQVYSTAHGACGRDCAGHMTPVLRDTCLWRALATAHGPTPPRAHGRACAMCGCCAAAHACNTCQQVHVHTLVPAAMSVLQPRTWAAGCAPDFCCRGARCTAACTSRVLAVLSFSALCNHTEEFVNAAAGMNLRDPDLCAILTHIIPTNVAFSAQRIICETTLSELHQSSRNKVEVGLWGLRHFTCARPRARPLMGGSALSIVFGIGSIGSILLISGA